MGCKLLPIYRREYKTHNLHHNRSLHSDLFIELLWRNASFTQVKAFMLKGKEMEISAVIFILGVIALISAVYINSKSDSTAFQDTLKKISFIEGKYKDLEKVLNSNITSVGNMNVRLESMLESNKKTVASCESVDKDIVSLHQYCAKLKDSEIDLREKLSKKRPIIKFDTPITFEVVQREVKTGQGVKALIKEKKK